MKTNGENRSQAADAHAIDGQSCGANPPTDAGNRPANLISEGELALSQNALDLLTGGNGSVISDLDREMERLYIAFGRPSASLPEKERIVTRLASVTAQRLALGSTN